MESRYEQLKNYLNYVGAGYKSLTPAEVELFGHQRKERENTIKLLDDEKSTLRDEEKAIQLVKLVLNQVNAANKGHILNSKISAGYYDAIKNAGCEDIIKMLKNEKKIEKNSFGFSAKSASQT